MFFKKREALQTSLTVKPDGATAQVNIKVVGVGGGGGNAALRMADGKMHGVKFLALNTDLQALRMCKSMPTFAIGPGTTHGLGSGGQPETGRKAIRESQQQVKELLKDADMVFVTAGMGGGTGTGAASIVADMARKNGALTVGVVTLPFSFEGPRRRKIAENGLRQLKAKVDTLITIDNDRLLPSLNGDVRMDKAFELADRVLRQGVQGISDIITIPGLINVDFADVKAVMGNGGAAFMAMGEGKGRDGAIQAAESALSNPLFGGSMDGAKGILFNVMGGSDLTLGQVHEVADLIRQASNPGANVIFGLVQDKRMKKRVSITLVATGISREDEKQAESARNADDEPAVDEAVKMAESIVRNGNAKTSLAEMKPLF
ncbi:MAG: cell division protein FtsZ [SAR202 cluster bacterium]|jgi:cell division protein FtsZ|nr:cell division protein FtsZ [SAR202 cluster bacterium]MDP6716446.1 cell division protein FtsZ [SAR202 cluster bacterium]